MGARLSSYSYLVSLLPRQIIDELGLGIRLARRRVSSYTPDPRVSHAHGPLVDGDDRAGTVESFRRVTGRADASTAWDAFYAMTGRVARAVFPTMLEPLVSREQMRRLVDDEGAWQALFERPIGEAVAQAVPDGSSGCRPRECWSMRRRACSSDSSGSSRTGRRRRARR
jgi:hypothetical protein